MQSLSNDRSASIWRIGNRRVKQFLEGSRIKAKVIKAEYEEAKSALEISERAKILADSELRDSLERSNLLQTQNTTLVHAKRKAEQVKISPFLEKLGKLRIFLRFKFCLSTSL